MKISAALLFAATAATLASAEYYTMEIFAKKAGFYGLCTKLSYENAVKYRTELGQQGWMTYSFTGNKYMGESFHEAACESFKFDHKKICAKYKGSVTKAQC
ncbi:hypothetical protein GQ42DRAFT_31903 [Ramicandelaber brevisporus]|nr:hypothetical protein GQ42DRAFT_31903 [Ramicandelaber brevisporus]